MAVTETPATPDLALVDDTGLSSRTLMTGVGLAAEGVGALKVAGTELIDVIDATALRSFDVADGLVTDWAGPLVELARAPITISRAAYEAGRTGARRTLAVV
ncbi:MAG TPA: hypothetical protein VF228_16310 [Iamia sp.]